MMGLSLEIMVFIGVLAFMLVLAPIILHLGSPQGKIRKRTAKLPDRLHQARQQKEIDDKDKPGSLRKQSGDTSLPLITALARRLPNIVHLRDRLARAGLAVTAERYLVYTGFLFVMVAGACHLLIGSSILTCLLTAIIVSIGLPHFYVNWRTARQTKQFLQVFPDAIDLIVRGLKAGLPVTESMKMVSREIEPPVGTVFQTISEKMALGIPLEKTLYETARKYSITELDFFVTSIVLQRETGGNLSEILANLSEAMRQRLMMKLKIKAMSSEARASMYIIGALPLVVMGALKFISPEYIDMLFFDLRGNIALGIAGFMLGFGIFVMTRMTKFDI